MSKELFGLLTSSVLRSKVNFLQLSLSFPFPSTSLKIYYIKYHKYENKDTVSQTENSLGLPKPTVYISQYRASDTILTFMKYL